MASLKLRERHHRHCFQVIEDHRVNSQDPGFFEQLSVGEIHVFEQEDLRGPAEECAVSFSSFFGVCRCGDGYGIDPEQPDGRAFPAEKVRHLRVHPGVPLRVGLRVVLPDLAASGPDEERAGVPNRIEVGEEIGDPDRLLAGLWYIDALRGLKDRFRRKEGSDRAPAWAEVAGEVDVGPGVA